MRLLILQYKNWTMKRTFPAVFFILTCLFFSGSVVAGSVEDTAVLSVQPNGVLTLDSLSLEERKWFKTFQDGTFLVDGWVDITKELLAGTPEGLRESQKKHLDQLGLKIGLEWCKNNDIRRIDTKMLQQWGKELKKIAKKNPEQLSEIIVSIDQELKDILN